MTTLADTLARFSQTHGASGFEDSVRALVVREFKKVVDEIQITPLGSVIGIKRARTGRSSSRRQRNGAGRRSGTNIVPHGRGAATVRGGPPPRLLVEAHMDEIGLLVTGIEDGFIRFDEIGHFDPRVLPSQNVLVHGRKTLDGVIGARPPHVLTAQEREKAIPLRDLYIDVGMSDARARELVSVGDFITLERNVIPLLDEYVAGKAMDDRACLVALLEMLRRLEGMPHAWDIYAVANVNEEDSAVYVGALTSTYAIQPQIAICLDVTHGLQPGLSDEAAPGVSRGPCIARGANIHPFVFDKLRVVAEQGELKHQVTVYGGNTETNGWMMQVAGAGVATGLVELPLRYMHTSVETIHRDDVAGMAELLSAFAGTLDLEDASALEGERFVRGTARGESKKPARPTKRKIQRGKRKQPVVARRARRLKRRR